MSLKAFHFLFIVVAILLSLGFAGWSLVNYYSPVGRRSDLFIGVASVALAVGLAIYERFFVKKLKNVSYL
jgi:hypothetical protein